MLLYLLSQSSADEEDENDDNSPTIDNESGAQKKGIYKPPKLAAVPYCKSLCLIFK